jgi:hypothetical protein
MSPTTTPLSELQAKVRAQKTLNPRIYGGVDFDIVPERFTRDVNVRSQLPPDIASRYRAAILADGEKVDRQLAYTMLGDVVADPYAALIPEYGFRRLVDMLVMACEKGVDAVPGAPPELERFVASMETLPDWIDPTLSAQGGRASRVSMAILAPFFIRGAFIATFMNKYAGLPMALTGALSNNSSVQRVKETASFFTTATLPGALGRFGPGFRAAAMVRLMHSMVRANLLMRAGRWDVSTYGIPIPQIDQMPAGTIPAVISAYRCVRENRGFTNRERAIVELCRHQCFLLGLPGELLQDTPQSIFDAMMLYSSTLRDGYDDETNGKLVRATMAAYLPSDRGLRSRVKDVVERSVSKVFFKTAFRVPDDKARQMGVVPGCIDYAIFTAFHAYAVPTVVAHTLFERLPVIDGVADHFLVERINRMLVDYGHAEYTTDPAKYRASTDRAAPGAHAPHPAVTAPAPG